MNDIDDAEAHPLSLSIGVSAVRCSDGVVLLDVTADHYFCVYDPITPNHGHRATDPLATPAAHALVIEQGLASATPLTDAMAAHQALVTITTLRDDVAVPRRPLRLRDIRHFARALLRAGIAFRSRSFPELLDHVRTRYPAPPVEPARRAEIIAQFERLCLWLPFRFDCLFRSFFLLHFLAAHRLRADWIFGVSLFPFAAHCWLADESVLLGERAHRIEAYTQILLIRRASA